MVSRARPFGVLGFATGSRYRVTLAAVDLLPDFAVAEVSTLDDPGRTAVSALLRRVGEAQAHPPLPEPQLLGFARHGGPGAPGQVVLARDGDRLAGAAFLSPARDGSTVVHVVVDPESDAVSDGRSADLAGALIDRAAGLAPAGAPVHLWAMHAGAQDDARAEAHGFAPERDLLQLRVALPLAPTVVDATRPLAVRAFVPGHDDEVWVDTNNRAFAGHPEQGAWTTEQLRERLAADWVDLEGFLVADDPDGDGLIGSCWTKVHRDSRPVLGEIYVISVDPRHGGQGWGRSLTVAGLQWLAGRGIRVGMLYTDATNEAALALYHALGFTLDHTDRSYRRPPA
jgi:mycothiol synthase